MSKKTKAQKQQTYVNYLALSEEQRFLVQIFALMYEPISRAQAHDIWLNAMELQDIFEDVAPISIKDFRPWVRALVEVGVLIEKSGSGAQCAPEILEWVVRDAVWMRTFEPIARTIEDCFPARTRYASGSFFFRNERQFMRELRIAIYRQDREAADALLEAAKHAYWQAHQTLSGALYEILTDPFDADWVDSLSDEFFELGITAILEASVRRCIPATEAFDLLDERYRRDRTSINLTLLYAEQLWLRGDVAEAADVLFALENASSLKGEQKGRYCALSGTITFLTGNTAAAIAHYQSGLRAVGKSQRAQAEWFQQPAALPYFFALLEEDTPATLSEAEQHILLLQRTSSSWLNPSMPLLFAVVQQQRGKLVTRRFDQYTLMSVGLLTLLESYCLYWLNIEDIADWVSLQLPYACKQMLKAEYGWIALETAELLVNYQPDSPFTTIVETLRAQADSLVLLDIVERKEAWERSLDALTALASVEKADSPTATLEDTYRMIWRLHFESLDNWTLTAVEQKLSVKGGWTKGKVISPKRLYGAYKLPDCADEQDRKICETIDVLYDDSYYYRNSATYAFSVDALLALADHPRVFLADSPDVRVDVMVGEPELLVKRLEGDRLRLSLLPPLTRRDVMVVKETPTRIKVIEVSEQHKRIAEVLGPANRLEVPAQAKERVLKAIASIADLVTVQSDIGGGVEAEEVLANATPHVHLLPAGDGLRASVLIHPFPAGGAYYKPGEGGETVISVVEGKRLKTQRDLVGEQRNAEAVSNRCPVLLHYEPEFGEWLIDEPQDCLELLLQLKQLGDDVVIEWPEGEAFKVSRQLGSGDFKFDVRRKQDWFAASGELRVSDNQVVDLQQLMRLLEKTPGQFVPMDNGEFLALTDEFRQRLKTLSRLSQRSGKSLRIHGLAALAVDEMIDEFEELRVDQEWRDHLQQIRSAQKIEPEVPDLLQATLRDYQREGYVWLSRLANWGVGACLADDMGLGKTLQGLAVMLARADRGPALVIAPTSVCMNWSSEAARFAPSLRVQSLGEGDRTDRQALLNKLGENDLLVCSYGLVQQQDV
ncbi:MAG: DEAD/DEAH box helicase, partial [Cyanobacteria bacterium J06632_3]